MDATRPTPTFMSTDPQRDITHVTAGVGARLMRFIRRRVASDADAEDILQDVWQQLITALDAGPIEQVGAWLYTVARHRIIDRHRKPAMASLEEMSGASTDEADLDLVDWLLREEKTPRTEHLRHVFWEELHHALAELPEEQRQVFVWHELEALSFEDIAALTGENVNTLLSRKRYAVLHLRARLAHVRDEFRSQPR